MELSKIEKGNIYTVDVIKVNFMGVEDHKRFIGGLVQDTKKTLDFITIDGELVSINLTKDKIKEISTDLTKEVKVTNTENGIEVKKVDISELSKLKINLITEKYLEYIELKNECNKLTEQKLKVESAYKGIEKDIQKIVKRETLEDKVDDAIEKVTVSSN